MYFRRSLPVRRGTSRLLIVFHAELRFLRGLLRVNGFRLGRLTHDMLDDRMIRIAAVILAVPCYGSSNWHFTAGDLQPLVGFVGRHAGFGALRCGYAYGGWICFGGWWNSAAKGAGFVIGVVVTRVVIVNLVGITTSDILDRLALLLQLAHVCFESGFEFALSAA